MGLSVMINKNWYKATLGRRRLKIIVGLGRQAERHGRRRGAKSEAESLRLTVHIVGGRTDDGILGDPFGFPAKTKEEPQAGNTLSRPAGFVNFCRNRHGKTSFCTHARDRYGSTAEDEL